MASLNKVQIIGNLTKDPELKQTTSGKTVCTVGVATSTSWKNATGEKQEKAEYHNIVVWGKLAEICGQYLQKGKKVYFEGKLQTRDWEGQDGVRRYRTEIVADNMIMLSKGERPTQTIQAPVHGGHMVDEAPATEEIQVEDIPFS